MKALLVAGLALALAGCGSATVSPKHSGSPRPSASASALTPVGADLSFGQTALVDYQPNRTRRGQLALTVTSVSQAAWSDFAGYGLQAVATQTPYYVFATVRNSGTTDLGGVEIPLWAVDSQGRLVHAAAFANSFAPCPSLPLPASFRRGEQVTTCIVFVLQPPGTLSGVAFRSAQTNGTIIWRGPVATPSPSPSPAAASS